MKHKNKNMKKNMKSPWMILTGYFEKVGTFDVLAVRRLWLDDGFGIEHKHRVKSLWKMVLKLRIYNLRRDQDVEKTK